MRSSVDAAMSQNGRHSTATSTTVNNANTGNSGSQYALCALGVGLVALGIVMIVWSVVPVDPPSNNSVNYDPDPTGKKSKASSVAFVLVGSGVAVLLLSMCLGMRNKQREQQYLQQQRQAQTQAATGQTDAETAEEQAQRYAVPTYEEAVGSGQYPVRQSNLRPSVSQLPSYEDLVPPDNLQYESEGASANTITATVNEQPANANRKLGKNKLLPIKIRRIKSEKIRINDGEIPQAPTHISIEPLTPPPQYEDKVPPL
ncbi:transmembrane protein 51a [Boleophthalmus pectinirostris]|uniref:transmembrane protein 51a n=1 Tax=Boleophthalmus pectinirostris TaxID=150288 RepID=UPI002430EA70|nr:transmembrane protein 51a [Boleophthalmus pectinirostris]XP_020789117.2 transmembrane protein 51a [Boleophthalmus pectinirostris]